MALIRMIMFFIINNKNITLYGSQGQQRSSLVSTKLAFVEILEKKKKENIQYCY